MLTPEEYAIAQASIAQAETNVAQLDQLRRDCIDKAREFNAQTKDCTLKITGIERVIAPIRQQVAEYNAEQKRQAVEKLKAERAAAEAQAVKEKAAEQSELTKAQAEIEQLKAALAAKG